MREAVLSCTTTTNTNKETASGKSVSERASKKGAEPWRKKAIHNKKTKQSLGDEEID